MSKENLGKYCTYITVINHNDLPFIYIGSGNTENVISGKYHGSVSSKQYKEIFNIIKSDKSKVCSTIINTFSTREEAYSDEIKIHSFYDVARQPIFLNKSRQLTNKFSVEGLDRSGEKNSFYGKKHSAESLAKISKHNTERGVFKEQNQDPEFRKQTSDRLKKQASEGIHPSIGLTWITNGLIDKKAKGEKLVELLKNGFYLGRKGWTNKK
jgi:hypothetical protein